MNIIEFIEPKSPNRYTRTGYVSTYESVPVTFKAQVYQGDETIRARVVLLQGVKQNVIATGEFSTQPFELTVDTLPDNPLEPLVVSVETESVEAWTISRAVHIGTPPDTDTPRWMAVTPIKHRWPEMNFQGVGYVWWPGVLPERSSAPYVHRPGRSWSYDEPSFYAQRMTIGVGVGDYFPEFVLDGSGNVSASWGRTQYFPISSSWPEGLKDSLFRDGPRNIGSVGFPVGGFVDDDDSLVAASSPGRIFRIDLSGNVSTIAGWRLNGLAPQGDANPDDLVEFVGTLAEGPKFSHIWDVQRGPDGNLYVADVGNHSIRRIDPATGEITVFAGSVDGEPGLVDGVGHDARFTKPRGVAFKDNFLYVADALNHAIRRIDLSTRTVETVVESAEKPHPMTFSSFDESKAWSQAGAFGEAKFMHPVHCRFTPDGKLLAVMHHQAQVLEFDLDTEQVHVLVEDVPSSAWRDQMRTWQTMHVDDGSTGPAGTIYTNGWEHETDAMYDRQGNLVGPFSGQIFNRQRQRMNIGWEGQVGDVRERELGSAMKEGYSQFTVTGQGAIWWGGVSGTCIRRLTPIESGEDFAVDYDSFNRGRELWIKAPSPRRPSLSLIHGAWGLNGFGTLTIDDLGLMTREEFGAWLVDQKHRDDLSVENVDDLYTFVTAGSTTARGLSDGVETVPTEPDPTPPEEEPTSPPEDEEPTDEEPTEESPMTIYAEVLRAEHSGQWDMFIPDVAVPATDGVLVAFFAVRRGAEFIEPGTEDNGVEAVPMWGDHPMEFLGRFDGTKTPDTEVGKWGDRGVIAYALRNPPVETHTITGLWGRVGGSQSDTSGRTAGAALFVGGDVDIDNITVNGAQSDNYEYTHMEVGVDADAGDVILDCLCAYDPCDTSDGRGVAWRDNQNVNVHSSGSIVESAGGNHVLGWDAPNPTSMAIVALRFRPLSGTDDTPDDGSDEQPEHPALQHIRDAEASLAKAKEQF